MAKEHVFRKFRMKARMRRQRQAAPHEEILADAKRKPVPAPQSKEEAKVQIKKLVKENKASLDALSKL